MKTPKEKIEEMKLKHYNVHHWQNGLCPTCIELGKEQAIEDIRALIEKKKEEFENIMIYNKEEEDVLFGKESILGWIEEILSEIEGGKQEK